MKILGSGVPAVFLLVLFFLALHPRGAASQESEDVNRGFYVGSMVAVPFGQNLYHQTSFPLGGNAVAISADLDLDYGIGFAAVLGNRISDYLGVELTGTWSRQSSDLRLPLPPALAGQLSAAGIQLPGAAAGGGVTLPYRGRVIALQSKLDLLLYPARIPVTSSGVAEPYLGGGAGVVRSDIDVDIVLDQASPLRNNPIIPIPGKVTSKQTDLQMSLRAGVNVPFDRLSADLGWQFYRTYNKGKNSNSHVVGLIIKYAL